MYTQFYGLSEAPFSLTPNTQFYCALAPHNEALQAVLFALHMGEGFLKVVGEVGTGKTLLCRKILNTIEGTYTVAYLPNPYLNPEELRWEFAKELGLSLDKTADQQTLTDAIHSELLNHHKAGKKVVLLIDEAQSLSWEALEALRLFTNLETESKKLLHMVLLGQPELDDKLANPRVRQLRQRISFSYRLRPMTLSETVYYIKHRLMVAGGNKSLINEKLCIQIAKASGGVARLVNLLCHKALLHAYGQGRQMVTKKDLNAAILDTHECAKPWQQSKWFYTAASITIGVGMALSLWLWERTL